MFILVLTSARLRSIKASRELIQELPPTTAQPNIPTGKVVFTLEGITRTLNGWNIPGGWVEGMGLVRAATGQVFKVCANQEWNSDLQALLSFCCHQVLPLNVYYEILNMDKMIKIIYVRTSQLQFFPRGHPAT